MHFPWILGTGQVLSVVQSVRNRKSVSEFDWMLPLIYLKSATAVCVHIIKTGCGQADAHRLVALLVSDGQCVCSLTHSLNENTRTLNIDI